MSLARPILALDLTAELWPLVNLIVAIFQPVVVLLLCGGLVIASTHLLAMLGTQWGNRRVTGKALIFSLVIHASLVCGVVALVPDYRLTRTTAFESNDGIEIASEIEAGPTSFDGQLKGQSNEGHPWEKLTSSTVPAPSRGAVETPQSVPADVTPAMTRLPVEAQPLPEPVFEQLPPPPQEPDELAQSSNVPKEYNPATFQPTMDSVATPQAPSRAAPALTRSTPGIAKPSSDASLMQPDQLPANLPDQQVPLEAEGDQPSVLPDPESMPLVQSQTDQTTSPSGSSEAPNAEPSGDSTVSQPLPSQAGAPAVMPRRSAPKVIPKAIDGLTKLDQPEMRRPTSPNIPETGQEFSPTAKGRGIQGDKELPGDEIPPDIVPLDGLSPNGLSNSTPAQYRLRSSGMRGQALEQFGGSVASEAAVDLALQWLASIQDADGFWDGDAFGTARGAVGDALDGAGRDSAIGRNADAGLTALAILAFLGKQNTLEEGEYSENVTRALHWLIEQQGKSQQNIDGYLGGNASEVAGVYSHAMATFAMAEAYAMTKDPEKAQFLVEPLQRAIRFTLTCQLEDGGWRYKRGQQGGGDMSIFGWHLMSLKSAQAAGMEIPLANRQKMILFLQQRGVGRAGGLASYRRNESPTLAMTAESLFCKQMLGLPREHPSCEEAVKFLLTNPPTRQSMNLYSWYYSTLALYQYGGDAWEQWNLQLRDLLIAEQVTEGEFAGSWEPRDQWGTYGGRIYATTFATLTLEVYYRYLPLYRTTAPTASSAPQDAEPQEGETVTP